MRVKHYKLIASVVMLVSLLLLPLVNYANVTMVKPVNEVKKSENEKLQLNTIRLIEYKKEEKVQILLNKLYNVDYHEAEWWSHFIIAASTRYNIPENYMISLLAVESKFNRYPKKKNGLIGPMQIKSKYWKNNGEYNISDPGDNIMLGGKIFRDYKNQCGNWECAVKSYNVGIGAYLNGANKRQQGIYAKLVNNNLAMINSEKIKMR